MIEIVLHQSDLNITDLPNGAGKVLRFTSPTGIVVSIPMNSDAVRQLSAALSGVEVVTHPLIVPLKKH